MTEKGVDYWNSVGVLYSRHRQKLWRAHSDAVNCSLLARWLPKGEADRVLKTDLFDEMCGDGLYPLLSSYARCIVGIDLSLATLEGARSRHADLPGITADVRHLPFAGGAFELIVSNSTLDHFESRSAIKESLAELYRVLCRGGQLIITMDNPVNPIIALRRVLPHSLLNRSGITPYYVGATCNARDLRHLLEETGFEVLEITTILHCPRVFAVAASPFLEKYAPAWMQRGFLRILAVFEQLERWPTQCLTGHFVAARAVKPVGTTEHEKGTKRGADHAM